MASNQSDSEIQQMVYHAMDAITGASEIEAALTAIGAHPYGSLTLGDGLKLRTYRRSDLVISMLTIPDALGMGEARFPATVTTVVGPQYQVDFVRQAIKERCGFEPGYCGAPDFSLRR